MLDPCSKERRTAAWNSIFTSTKSS